MDHGDKNFREFHYGIVFVDSSSNFCRRSFLKTKNGLEIKDLNNPVIDLNSRKIKLEKTDDGKQNYEKIFLQNPRVSRL